ncbi:MAG TPA: outer membrane protein assembly factor BamA [Alphaproteobacteria bacterium]
MAKRWMRMFRPVVAAFAAAAAVLAAGTAFAQIGQPTQRVTEIRVEGSQRIEPETVRSYMTIRPGDALDPVEMDKALKSLFATGLFADVNMRQEGGAIVVRVVENPIINRVAFEGNRRMEDKDLQNEIQLRPRVVYTRSRVQRDVQRIIDIYRRSGRFAVTVDPKVIQLPQNRVDLVFEINEGPLTKIRRITFVGNKRFSDDRLRDVVQTKESAWYRFLSTNDVYDPDRLTFDRELLRRHYLKNGYADFRVVSAVAELAPTRTEFFVTFTVEEGERYKFGNIDVQTGLRNLDPVRLNEFVEVKEGDWYDADAVEATINKITDAVGVLGYAFVEIRPRVRRSRENLTIDVTFDIQEGPRVFVERVDIVGNLRTEDRVVRREIRLVEGDAFNSAKLRQSRRNIQNLGFFDKVEVTNVPGSTPDRTVLKVEVRERSTGELSFGAGISTTIGLLGDVSIRERNLLGRGQDLRLALRLGERLSSLDLSFTEPYFLDRPLSAGFDVFNTRRDFQRQASFDKEELGFALRSGYQITTDLRQSWRYTLRRDEIKNVGSDASLFVKEQAGKATTSLIGQSLLYDKRDNRIDPTDGYFVRVGTDFAGLGGTVTYVRGLLEGTYYYPVADQYVLSVSSQVGRIVGIGETVRIGDRFFVGGENLRGFDDAGVGPRDRVSEDALGGTMYYTGSVELSFPLGLPSEFAILGKAFADFGSLWDAETPIATDTDTKSIRASVGVGLAWRSPFGPIRVDFAKPVIKENFDVTEIVRFSFGTRF